MFSSNGEKRDKGVAIAQVTLIPSESKKLIAMAVAKMEVVKQAWERGTIVIHPSSSTYFIVEELLSKKPWTNVWLCGVVTPKGTCIEMGSLVGPDSIGRQDSTKKGAIYNPGAFSHSWVIRGKQLSTGMALDKLLRQMGPKDVYIKGANALDTGGNVGVLVGNAVEGGTIGRVTMAARQQGFTIIYPIGLEKLIPIPIQEAAKAAHRTKYDYSMGLPCGLFPCPVGLTVTELEALQVLCDCNAVPIASGGLGGAEGAVTLVLSGTRQALDKAANFIRISKGASLPPVRTFICAECPISFCGLSHLK